MIEEQDSLLPSLFPLPPSFGEEGSMYSLFGDRPPYNCFKTFCSSFLFMFLGSINERPRSEDESGSALYSMQVFWGVGGPMVISVTWFGMLRSENHDYAV